MNVPNILAYLLTLSLMPFLVFGSIQPLNNTQARTRKYFGQYFTELSGKPSPVPSPISTPDPNLFPQNKPPQYFPVVTDNEPLAPGQAFALPVIPPQSLPPTNPQSGLPPLDTRAQVEPFQYNPTISPNTAPFPSFEISDDDDIPDNVLPPFPSELPPLLSADISSVTSPGFPLPTDLKNLPPASLAQRFPSFIPLPTATNNAAAGCSCVPIGTCVTLRGGNGVINVRIVTQNQGVACAAGQQYCCSQNTNQPQTASCGIQNIITGVSPAAGQANFGEFPWSAIVLDSAGQYVGGGALIDQYHLLTAAHLVSTKGNGAGMTVRLGEWDISGTYEPVAPADYNVAGIVIHPSFVASTLQHDLAIIRLTAPAAILTAPTPQVNTVCLPAASDVFTGIGCFVAGWGKDSFVGSYQNIIKKVDVPVLGNADCQARLRTTRLGPNYVLDTTSFICAGGQLAKDACQGDGGNALVCGNNGKFFVAGITAGGVNCGQQGIPGLYVHVSSYLAWIAQQTANVPTTTGTIDPRRGG